MAKRSLALGCAAALSVGAAVIGVGDTPVEAGWGSWRNLPRISIDDSPANEADGELVFDVSLNKPANRTVNAWYLTRNGSAKAGVKSCCG